MSWPRYSTSASCLSGVGHNKCSVWAWKQPSFEESVIAHWSSLLAPKCNEARVHYRSDGILCILVKLHRAISGEKGRKHKSPALFVPTRHPPPLVIWAWVSCIAAVRGAPPSLIQAWYRSIAAVKRGPLTRPRLEVLRCSS